MKTESSARALDKSHQHVEVVAAAYDRAAARWAAHRTKLPANLRQWLERFVRPLSIGAAVLDVGCAHGIPVGRFLTERGFAVTGLDISRGMIALARSHAPYAKLIRGDMRIARIGARFDALVAWDSV